MKTVADAVRGGAAALERFGVPQPRLDAEILLSHVIDVPRSLLPARLRDPLPAGAAERYDALLSLRGRDRVPIQYITGRQEFFSLEFRVDGRVLIPRPETERLVEELLSFRASEREMGRAVRLAADVGTGSGCVAVAVAVNSPEIRFLAIDISPGALEVAASNCALHAVSDRVGLVAGHLLAPVATRSSGALDAVLCNPPYVADSEFGGLQAEVRDHEPHVALVGGPSGNEAYEELLPAAAGLLRPGGLLALELAPVRSSAVRAMLEEGPWQDIALGDDFQGLPRVITARRRAS